MHNILTIAQFCLSTSRKIKDIFLYKLRFKYICGITHKRLLKGRESTSLTLYFNHFDTTVSSVDRQTPYIYEPFHFQNIPAQISVSCVLLIVR